MIGFGNVAAIVSKEWRHYFGSPIAWVALAVWTLLFGGFYLLGLDMFLQQSLRGQGMQFGPQALSLNEWVIGPVLQNMQVVALFVAPMLTMRLLAEEKRQGTLELLQTSPLTAWHIVLGKFLAAVGLFAIMVLAGIVNFGVLWAYASSPPEWAPLATGALAVLLLGASFIALGLFVSALTRNQIVAGFVSFGLLLGIWILGWSDTATAGPVMQKVAYFAPTSHMEDLIKGVVDLKDLAYYVSFIGFALLLAHQTLESQRWRA